MFTVGVVRSIGIGRWNCWCWCVRVPSIECRQSPDCDNYASASVFAFGLAFMLAFGRIAPVLFVPSPGAKHLLQPFLGHGHGVSAKKATFLSRVSASDIRKQGNSVYMGEEFGVLGTRDRHDLASVLPRPPSSSAHSQ